VAGVALRSWVPPLFCVAGMVLGHMEALGWLVARFVVRRRAVLCGRCGTYGTGLALVWWHRRRSCVAGVALVDVTYLGVTVVGSGVALTSNWAAFKVSTFSPFKRLNVEWI